MNVLDPLRWRFGAGTHRYRLNPPISEQELVLFETGHGFVLPDDYRSFLLEVGNAAGPAAGTVWNDFLAGDGGLRPTGHTFASWYKEWLWQTTRTLTTTAAADPAARDKALAALRVALEGDPVCHITVRPTPAATKAIVKLLLARGADPNLADERGNTPLMKAVEHCDAEKTGRERACPGCEKPSRTVRRSSSGDLRVSTQPR